MKTVRRLVILPGSLLAAASSMAQPPQLAVGPSPGGTLGEDMPFPGDDVVRRAPAKEAPDPGAAKAGGCPPAGAEPEPPGSVPSK